MRMGLLQKQCLVLYLRRSYNYISRGSKGVNELAPVLLDNKLSYPAFVVLGTDLHKMGLFKGYSEPEEFMVRVNKVIGEEGS